MVWAENPDPEKIKVPKKQLATTDTILSISASGHGKFVSHAIELKAEWSLDNIDAYAKDLYSLAMYSVDNNDCYWVLFQE